MNRLLTNKILSGILGIFIVGIILASSTAGIVKVVNSFEKAKPEVPQVQTINNSPTNPTGEVLSAHETAAVREGSEKESPTIPHPTGTNLRTGSSLSALSVSNQTITPSPTPTSSTDCIITLFGKQYNVTPLITTHSGGNVFKCGTDMTVVYQGQHGTDVSRMQAYLVTSGSTGSTGGQTGGLTGSGSTGSTGGTQISEGEREELEDHKVKMEQDLHDAVEIRTNSKDD